MTDCRLLERFVADQDDAAFTTLVRRHAPRVLGVCRRVLRNEQDAEDVFQATFLVLARKAVALSWRSSVGPWLAAVAYRLALKVRSRERKRPERPIATVLDELPELTQPGSALDTVLAGRELHGMLHEEVARLPEKYRAPLVLCYLEGKSNEQAARELGWPSGSMSRRLERARQLLRQRLTVRGIGVLMLLLCLPLALLWRNSATAPSDPEIAGRVCPVEMPRSESDPTKLLALAGDALRAADQMKRRDPGRRPDDWRRFTHDLEHQARRLTNAVERRDRTTTLVASARLYAACHRCHETFRD